MFHYYRFGNVLIGSHHGDKVNKLQRLPLVMAADRPRDWGETTHRMFIIGHLHQDKVLDLPGCRVESVRILPPEDAWAHESGYRPYREMKMLLFHTIFGEISRFFVKPQMLEANTITTTAVSVSKDLSANTQEAEKI